MAHANTRVSISDQLREGVVSAMDSGWSIAGIAAEAGVPRSTLSAWLSGSRDDIALATAEKLAKWMNVRLTKGRVPRVAANG